MARLIRAELPDPYQLVVRFRKSRDEPFLTWLEAQPVGQISELIRRRLNELAARGELGGTRPSAATAGRATGPQVVADAPPAANDTRVKPAPAPRLNARLNRLMRNDDAMTKDSSHG